MDIGVLGIGKKELKKQSLERHHLQTTLPCTLSVSFFSASFGFMVYEIMLRDGV